MWARQHEKSGKFGPTMEKKAKNQKETDRTQTRLARKH